MRRISFLLSVISILTLLAATCYGQSKVVLVEVKRNYTVPAVEKARLIFDWNELTKRMPGLKPSNLKVTDEHFGGEIPAIINDKNKDGKPDQVILDYTFNSNEPVFAFKVSQEGKGGTTVREESNADNRFVINYLIPFSPDPKSKQIVAEKIMESVMAAYPNPKDLSIISPGKWTYEYGFFLNGAFKLSQEAVNASYQNYAKQWVDGFIGPDGLLKASEYKVDEYRLDDILPGRLCISLYTQNKEEKYKKVANQLIRHLTDQPKTSDGGYWHKKIYPNQMWLDGIFMGDVFSVQYAATFNEPHWFNEAALQIKLMYQHAHDPATGLMYHGWDESKNKVWADQQKGTSPEFWSRAIGWYAMAIIESLDYFPKDHPDRKNIESIFKELCVSIKKYQDKESGLWFQVTDKGNLPDNWIETSGSAMFTYAFAKGFHKGLLDKSFGDAADKAYKSLVDRYLYQDDRGGVHLDETVKVGSLNMKNSKGDYAYYISCERRLDDFKGLAALMYASMELKK